MTKLTDKQIESKGSFVFTKKQLESAVANQWQIDYFKSNGVSFEFKSEGTIVRGFAIGDNILVESITEEN